MSINLNELTKKNQEFIHTATKQLIHEGKNNQEIEALLETILPTILENQKKGIPARGLFGSPTAWALEQVKPAGAEKAPENESPFLMWVDTSLLILAFFAVVQGLVSLLSSQPEIYGLTTILSSSAVGGLVFYAMYHYVYRFMGQDRSKRPPLWKSFLILTACTLLWILAFSITSLLPAVINPVLPNLGLVLVGVLAFGSRYLLKKKYNIKSTIQSSRIQS
ncbi:DUF1129 domain-containing protein [Streptococcus himalayensis]|uniref:Membrane protein n=1 Tax=Streptococcus himalayensis TaxID=1888195 RepID=A0A917AAD3_9STRE|nr:DUF1129 domain-containing protein [Streptococcus himalayensis]GGE38007.1 membrane protein [Streptococcus himalayensis]